jgi:hypothetical protein
MTKKRKERKIALMPAFAPKSHFSNKDLISPG